jgi:hypothetical protein
MERNMADRRVSPTGEASGESAEMAYRRIVRRKLIERGYREDQIESKTADLLQKGLKIDPRLLTEACSVQTYLSF